MLEPYLFPISYAFMTFPIAALLCAIPFLVVQYRKYGYFNKFRGFLLYLFLLYLMNAVYLVLLPLPASRHNDPLPVSSYMQWVPFEFVQDIMRETKVVWSEPSTYIRLLKERAFLQVVFNVLLVVPFGMFLRYYARAKWLTCLIASFGLSLLFEITQVTGIYGFYDYPYRLFDVDDLMMNTLGGMIGLVLADWLKNHLPRMERLDEDVDLSTKRVSYTRRGIAFAADMMLLLLIWGGLVILRVPGAYFIVSILYFIVLPYMNEGRTVGSWIVRIRISGEGEHLKLKEILIRNGLLYVVVGGLHSLVFTVHFPGLLHGMYLFGLLIMDGWVFIHLVLCLLNRDRKLLHEYKSNTKLVIG
ncbi:MULTISPECIES: VanZ family protein [Paenibacillus]|uniref:Teicoplanin resistance protein VanZ n=1 Tax=Paenibacillus campinasensis TaxID=66347 RepID=A0A268EFS7_9BACL|nr:MULTISPECIES: VanZ family protein [Paenibacillus]MUG67205.1 teicoplanin resistance protein VanZ [Paenibacillus campinasensis]PAD71973.1 teicoplanin resistance protein VanZ [Paenibacillus campinasensis]PAK48154.1 teicoplanin resistance protein VanZ [Paenibacillus sp. 7541]